MMECYATPKCSATHELSKFFCFTGNCALPAFGCSESCLDKHKHGPTTRQQRWSTVACEVRRILSRGLSSADEDVLRRQHSAVSELVEELKGLERLHQKQMAEQRTRQQLKANLEKVMSSLSRNDTSSITGADMARLLELMGDPFANGAVIQ